MFPLDANATFNANMGSPKAVIGSAASSYIRVHHANAIVGYLDDFHYASHQPITTNFPVEPQRPIPHLLTFLDTMDQLVDCLVYSYVFYDHGTNLVHFMSEVVSRDTIFQLPQAGSTNKSGVSLPPGRHRQNWWPVRPVWVIWAVRGPTFMLWLIP